MSGFMKWLALGLTLSGSAAEAGVSKPPSPEASGSIGSQIGEALESAVDITIETVTHPWVYGGLSLGVGRVDSHATGETDMKGSYRAFAVNVSFYFDRLTLEGGGGYFASNFSGEDADGLRQRANVDTTMLDGSARVRLGRDRRFEIGYTNEIIYGTASDFGPVEGANDKNYFYGVSMTWQPLLERNWRFGAKYLHSYTIKTRDVSFVALGVEYGLPIRGAEGEGG